ncbi:von Hippel-Lindau disease tumor suppressor-like [Apostichopus japonicus]|uniref:von Hippel-Lindau disease tumor suppressor-like n=1 Tax=Stichopus japonicus TaxID=307972 RepID=UPI003AB715D6
MPSHRNMQNAGITLRSDDSGIRAFATFVNCSQRTVRVFWIDFEGTRVDYTRDRGGLQPRQYLQMRTFEGHPWIFRDKESNDKLYVRTSQNKLEEVYFPVAWDGREAPTVRIQIPVYSLQDLCCQKIRRLVKSKDLMSLELPNTLKLQLLHPSDTIIPPLESESNANNRNNNEGNLHHQV